MAIVTRLCSVFSLLKKIYIFILIFKNKILIETRLATVCCCLYGVCMLAIQLFIYLFFTKPSFIIDVVRCILSYPRPLRLSLTLVHSAVSTNNISFLSATSLSLYVQCSAVLSCTYANGIIFIYLLWQYRNTYNNRNTMQCNYPLLRLVVSSDVSFCNC